MTDLKQFRTKSRNSPSHGWFEKSRAVAAVVGGMAKMSGLAKK